MAFNLKRLSPFWALQFLDREALTTPLSQQRQEWLALIPCIVRVEKELELVAA